MEIGSATATNNNNNNKVVVAAINNNNNKINRGGVNNLQQAQQNGHTHFSGKMQTTDLVASVVVEKKPIRLNSPVGASAISWHWSEKEKNNIGFEVLDIIKLAFVHFPELASPLKAKLESVDVHNYDQVRSLAKKLNKVTKETATARRESLSARGNNNNNSRELLHQIITRCYNRAVDNEKALNKHYEAFSSQTYGETSYERMQLIVEELKPTPKDVFVDLGSGVGQLVVQIAGGTQLQRAVGIEIAQLPSKFARKLETEFKKWMNWFGRPFQNFELLHGDFLSDEYRKLIIEEATIIFINNYAFQSDLETRIKRELLADLKDGTRIVSTKPYVPLNKQGAITDRQLNDISVITEVTEMRPCPNPCSWTSAYVPYYLHTINRTKLENYFLKLRNSSLRAKSSDTGSRRSSTPNSGKTSSNSRESSVCPGGGRASSRDKSSDNSGRVNGNGEEEFCFGPTTRRKWHDYVNEMEMKRRQSTSGGERSKSARSSSSKKHSAPSTAASTPTAVPPGGNNLSSGNSSAKPEMQPLHSLTTSENRNIVAINAPIPTKIFKKSDVLPVIKASKEGEGASANEATNKNNLTVPKLRLHQTCNKSAATSQNSTELASVKVIVSTADKLPTQPVVDVLASTSTALNTSSMPPNEEEMALAKSRSPIFEPISPPSKTTPITTGRRVYVKRSYERKEKSINSNAFNTSAAGGGSGGRGRPRKTAEAKLCSSAGSHSSPKVPRLSEDARDGMELMHQMTCAIQMGRPLDAASILADLANQKSLQHQQQQRQQQLPDYHDGEHRTCVDSSTPKGVYRNATALLPFPRVETAKSSNTVTTNNKTESVRLQRQNQHDSASDNHHSVKYPELNKFLDNIRNAYETFFDDFHQGKNGSSELAVGNGESTTKAMENRKPETIESENTKFASEFVHFRSILDQTPLKRSPSAVGEEKESNAEQFFSAESRHRLFSSGGSINSESAQRFQQTQKTSVFSKGPCFQQQKQHSNLNCRMTELQNRVEERRKWLVNAWAEFEKEVQLLNADLETLVTECQHQQHQKQEDIINQQQLQRQQQQQQQQQMAAQQILVAQQQQQQQQQLIAAAQAQLAAQVQQAQQQASAAAVAASTLKTSPNAQQSAATAATNATVNNQASVNSQLELLINEVRERYSQQLTAQHLLGQISQYGLMSTISPQEIAALQSIASGAALNGVVHQLSPIAAAAAAVVLQQQQQHSPIGVPASTPLAAVKTAPLPQQSLSPPAALVAAAPLVQNFLSTLDSLGSSNGTCSLGAATANISASLSAVSAELAHAAGITHSNSTTVSAIAAPSSDQHQSHQQHCDGGQQQQQQVATASSSFSLHQVNQNFACQQQQQQSTNNSNSSPTAATTTLPHITRESTVAEVVAEVAALPSTIPRKPFKPRPARTGGGTGKRASQHSNKHQPLVDDPKKQEEIERQIQDIVAKALEVDSAAKSAEKDRKARGGEKRNTKERTTVVNSSLSSLNMGTAVPTTSRLAHQSGIEYQVKAENAIMQNFLSVAVAASQQQAPIGINCANIASGNNAAPSTPTSAISGCGGDKQRVSLMDDAFRIITSSAPTPKLERVSSPALATPHQQQHFSFTPSSVALAIQQAGGVVISSTPNSCSSSSSSTFSSPFAGGGSTALPHHQMLATNSVAAAPSTPNNNNTFLSPTNPIGCNEGQSSQSPPFISLNLPPNTCALVAPPTNVVVKVESKLPPGLAQGHQRNHPNLS